jgi:ribonuclease HI
MPDFSCTVCGNTFTVHEKALEKYPGWEPKYCKEHSPKKGQSSSTKRKSKSRSKAVTQELDLTTAEVLERFTEGPESGIFTDGSARPNPGRGGWGVVRVRDGEVLDERYGESPDTTNNIMELTALVTAYQMLSPESEEVIYTDSELCVNILTKWAASWKKNGWKRKSGPIKNLELVKELYALYVARPNVSIEWVKAHNGWRWNEYADSLATAWARDTL